jgi:hypothetical protein
MTPQNEASGAAQMSADRDHLASVIHNVACPCRDSISVDYATADAVLAAGYVTPAEVQRRVESARTEGREQVYDEVRAAGIPVITYTPAAAGAAGTEAP